MPPPNYSPLSPEEGREWGWTGTDMGEAEVSPLSASRPSAKFELSTNSGDSISSRVHLPLAAPGPTTYSLRRFTVRALVNTIGPVFVAGWYLFIVHVYLRRPSINGVIQGYPIDAASMFYAWAFLSVFVLDWAKSGLAGAEASSIMTRAWAPNDALRLMWHADRSWGGPGGWWKAAMLLYARWRHLHGAGKHATRARGPQRLWYYLSLSSFLFFIAVPISGLTMDRAESLKYSNRKIIITGVNETTFNTRTSPFIWEQANSRWRQGQPTSPSGPTILFAPAGVEGASENFYDDAIHNVTRNTPISFFSGPQVSERAHGKAWGLQVNVACASANPYRGLKLLNVTSLERWYCPLWNVGDGNETLLADGDSIAIAGAPVAFSRWSYYGYNSAILVASDLDLGDGSDYINAGALPVPGTLETVIWQASLNPSTPDPLFDSIKSHPHVVVSRGNSTAPTYYGFGITCGFNSTVGFAELDARHRTFSHFQDSAAVVNPHSGGGTLGGNPGIIAIQSLVLGAFGNLGSVPGVAASCSVEQSITCSQWFGANVATGGIPTLFKRPDNTTVTQYPAISPERMQVAMYKLVGEMAIAMMSSGPGKWTGELFGLERAHDLIPGRFSWIPVLILLVMWVAVTVPPALYVCFRPRWSSTLDGFEMFKFGAEWRDVVHKIRDPKFERCTPLEDVPGMVGDMDDTAPRGFIGLSKAVAVRRRGYVFDHRQARA
ncbi:MAG: hypothetical protein M1839_003549 [Geoglossum umbratile]|nr:MAG: hypothetical protein M1839_003549 [Geoglossum umbratile]